MLNLAKKLIEIQKAIKPIEKDSQNPHFKSWYFDISKLLEDVKPVLSLHGVIVLQPLTVLDGKPAIQTILIDSESGEQFSTTMYIPETNDPQKAGAVISYFRRYALTSLLALAGEDDDAESAKPQPKQPSATKPVGTPVKAVQQASQPTGEHGNCKDCGAPNKKSQAGKLYCSKICWEKPKQDVPTIQVDDGYVPAPNAPKVADVTAEEINLEDIPF